MADKKFEAQVNYGWGLTLNMTGKAPAVANRIFPTYKDALDYINDYSNSAVEGLTLSVVNDTDELNGSYFVEKVGTLGDNNTYNNDGVLRKLVDSEDLNDIKQELDLFTIKKGSGTNSSLQVNAPGSDASGTNSLAVGMNAVASGYYSVAMGRSCSATGRSSIALGGIVWIIRLTGEPNAVTYQTNIAYVKLAKYIVGLKLVDASDYTIHVATIIATNVVDDTAFITVDKTLSESALSSEPYRLLGCNASGNSSIALAGCIKALGNNSTAEGYYTVAAGNYSHAEGHRSISSGVTSHAEGRETEASADYSHAEGYSTMAEATASHAEGAYSLASGDAAHAEGYGTVAAGNYSHAEGIGTIASGRDSHAEGYYTIATGKRSHAEGYAMHNIYLTGSNSTYQIRYGSNILNTFHFIRRCQGASILEITNFTKIATITSVNISDDGYTVTITTDTDLGELSNYKCSALVVIASGEASHTENSALSSGTDSHAGGWSLATNYYSFSHGCDCTADGETSTSFGTNTYSQNNSEFALGRSNHSHTGETLAELTLFSVGCGDFEEIDMSKRIEQQLPLPTPEDGTNALEIMLNGDIWLGGYEEGVKLFEGETKELNTYTKEELDVELDSKIESEPVSTSITNIEENLVSSALRKTPLTLTESEKEQARTNIGALQELTLTVKDNGNIVISNIQGLTKEFMPATPSGDPMHYAYIAAGAEWNDTEEDITKTITIPSWQNYGEWITEDVVHKSKCYRIGTCGDLTSSDMKVIYNDPKWWLLENMLGVSPVGRCVLIPKVHTEYYYKTYDIKLSFNANKIIQDLWLRTEIVANRNNQFSLNVNYINFLGQGSKFKRIIGVINFSKVSSSMSFNPVNLEYINIIKLKNSLNIKWSPNISKDSIKYMIVNAIPTSAITITLHTDAYARLESDTDIIAALEAKNTALEGTGGSVSLVSA